MSRLTRIGAATLGGVAVGGLAAAAAATRVWDRATARAVARLAAADDALHGGAPSHYTPALLAGLPAPVARYLEFALTPGQPLVRRARVEHAGTFAGRPGEWRRFTSVDAVVVRPPGFVWDAAIRMVPIVPVRVRDSYVRGEGAMLGALGGVLRVVDQRGTPEMAEASLQRFLAEAPWYPTALLPGDAGAGVTWTPIDDSTARATLTDGGVTASLDFHFAAHREVVRTSALRYRDVNGTPVLTPWVGYLGEYARADGMMVPMAGEVEWVTPDGPLPYWRGRITRVTYEPAR